MKRTVQALPQTLRRMKQTVQTLPQAAKTHEADSASLSPLTYPLTCPAPAADAIFHVWFRPFSHVLPGLWPYGCSKL